MGDRPAIHYMQYGMTACMKPGTPASWPEGETWSENWSDVTCPQCSKGKPPQPETFRIEHDKVSDRRYIQCRRCQTISFNPHDIEHHFCHRCGVFHDDLWPPARVWWMEHPDANE